MEKDSSKKYLDNYLDLQEKYDSYVDQFFGCYVGSKGTYTSPQKAMNIEELKKIKKMRLAVKEARDKWIGPMKKLNS